jgi:hypothetical protein
MLNAFVVFIVVWIETALLDKSVTISYWKLERQALSRVQITKAERSCSNTASVLYLDI